MLEQPGTVDTTSLGNQRDQGLAVFVPLTNALQNNAFYTLMDVIVHNQSEQEKLLHLNFLRTTINFIATERNSGLQPEDGVVHKIFGPKLHLFLIEEILLQVLDVLYAHFQPQAWANCMNGKLSAAVWRQLQNLSHAIAKVVPIVETVSRLLVAKFSSQSWHKTLLESSRDDRNGLFVTSIDPSRYLTYVKTGERTPSGGK